MKNILNVWKRIDYDCVKLKEYFSVSSQIYELVYEVLSTFLALDIKLQLEHNRQRWNKEIEILSGEEGAIKEHLDTIESLMIKQKDKLTSEISDTFKRVQANVDELFKQGETMRGDLFKENFDSSRGRIFEAFHNQYKVLRDNLFKIVSVFAVE